MLESWIVTVLTHNVSIIHLYYLLTSKNHLKYKMWIVIDDDPIPVVGKKQKLKDGACKVREN